LGAYPREGEVKNEGKQDSKTLADGQSPWTTKLWLFFEIRTGRGKGENPQRILLG